MEAELGVELLERDRHRVTLTRAGSAFLDEARAVVARAERSITIAREVADGRIGRLRLACGTGTFGNKLGHVLRRFAKENPGVAIDVRAVCDTEAFIALSADSADAALAFEIPSADARMAALRSSAWSSEPLAIALPDARSSEDSVGLTASDLRGSRFLACSAATYPGLHAHVHTIIASLTDEPPIIRYVEDPVALLGMIGAGFGSGFVPSEWCRLAPKSARIVPLLGLSPRIQTVLYRRSDRRDPVLDAFESSVAESLETDHDLTD